VEARLQLSQLSLFRAAIMKQRLKNSSGIVRSWRCRPLCQSWSGLSSWERPESFAIDVRRFVSAERNGSTRYLYAALTPAKDGTFLTERIPPGTYELAAYGSAPSTSKKGLYSGCSGPSFYAAVTIEVPAEGEVKVEDLVLNTGK
jgi:hypothetical protein